MKKELTKKELKIQKDTIKQLKKHWNDKDIIWNYENIKINNK